MARRLARRGVFKLAAAASTLLPFRRLADRVGAIEFERKEEDGEIAVEIDRRLPLVERAVARRVERATLANIVMVEVER
jgi:hypothetical protein